MTILPKQKIQGPPRSSARESRTVTELVAGASRVVAPVWPLKTFIAVNPLQGLEDLPFEEAVLGVERLKHACDGDEGREAVNRELIKWCSVFFDEGQAAIPMPSRALGLYRAFAGLAPYDRVLSGLPAADALLASLPDRPDEAIAELLDRMSIPEGRREDFLSRELAELPGWSGYVKWREHWSAPRGTAGGPATLVDYLAVRMVLTYLLCPGAATSAHRPAEAPAFLDTLPAAEARYRENLLGLLLPQARTIGRSARQRPDAQLVFCIDVRSEPLRRAIEVQGNYETLACAGFFGMPIRVKGYDDDEAHDSCPVLLKPAHEVHERTVCRDESRVTRHERGRSLLRMPTTIYQWLKYNFATPFALVEMLGPWLGLRMMARTFAPSLASSLASVVRNALMPPVPSEPALDAIPPDRQADYAESSLRMMGLTDNFAPLVVLCGHGSTTLNNAYGSALDCGACGGNHGGANARILAAILNEARIRVELTSRGLAIPQDTLFLAAEHDTTTDRVALDPPRHAGTDHRRRIETLRADLAGAGALNAQSRGRSLGRPGHKSAGPAAAKRRSEDWAEVRPEWGLARNAAFIVGPRELTRAVDLEGRCFLHSYDWTSDADGKFLTAILTAPMVVGQWINCQYLFSTLDNRAYGSGSKVTQNVTGKIGIMQGNASDLMHGLPLQSVYSSDERPYHEPLRLLTVVYAPRSSIDSIIRGQGALRKLFRNGWVTLACVEPAENRAYLRQRDGHWQAVC